MHRSCHIGRFPLPPTAETIPSNVPIGSAIPSLSKNRLVNKTLTRCNRAVSVGGAICLRRHGGKRCSRGCPTPSRSAFAGQTRLYRAGTRRGGVVDKGRNGRDMWRPGIRNRHPGWILARRGIWTAYFRRWASLRGAGMAVTAIRHRSPTLRDPPAEHGDPNPRSTGPLAGIRGEASAHRSKPDDLLTLAPATSSMRARRSDPVSRSID